MIIILLAAPEKDRDYLIKIIVDDDANSVSHNCGKLVIKLFRYLLI